MTSTFTIEQIVAACGAPRKNVALYWPLIFGELEAHSIDTPAAQIAVIATISTEVGSFEPINEYGSNEYFTRMYEGRKDLGNLNTGDGARYHGRGFIQLTGRYNYRTYGEMLDIPLEESPELALEPLNAAKILVLYFKTHSIAEQAQKEDWQAVRKSVNGGLNGWTRFIAVVEKLQGFGVRSDENGAVPEN